jgi:hypothetical protein
MKSVYFKVSLEPEIIVTSLDTSVAVVKVHNVVLVYYHSLSSLPHTLQLYSLQINVLFLVICFPRSLLLFEFDERTIGLVVFLLV